VRPNLQSISDHLWIASFCGLAIFVPFSIAGANVSIMLGFLASLIAVVVSPAARRRYRGAIRDPLFAASILLVVSALPSVFMSENLHRALRELKSYWLLLVYFLVAYNLVSDRLRRVVFWILFTSMSLSCAVALIQYGGGLKLLFLRIESSTYRPSSTLYTMTFAGILYQLITVNFAVLLRERAVSRRGLVLTLGLICQIASLLLTLTRGAWLALVGGLSMLPLLLKRRILLLTGAAGIVVVGVLALQSPTVRDRAATIIQNVREPTDKNIATRLVLWDISWQVFRKHPLLGVGLGDYSIEAEKHLSERFVTTTSDSHNIYLQLLATRGLVGFIPFVVFWVVLFRVLFESKRHVIGKDRFGYHFVAGTIAATVAVLIGALSENNIDDSEVFTAFLLLVGMARSFRVSKAASN